MDKGTCTIGGCDKPAHLKTMCEKHYTRVKRNGTAELTRPKPNTACGVEGCDKKPRGSLCRMHRARLERHGDPTFERAPSRWITSHGYVRIILKGHPVSESDGRAYEHRVVLYSMIGPGVHDCHWCGTDVEWKSTLHVDHVDGDTANNDPHNLVPSCQPCNANSYRNGISA